MGRGRGSRRTFRKVHHPTATCNLDREVGTPAIQSPHSPLTHWAVILNEVKDLNLFVRHSFDPTLCGNRLVRSRTNRDSNPSQRHRARYARRYDQTSPSGPTLSHRELRTSHSPQQIVIRSCPEKSRTVVLFS